MGKIITYKKYLIIGLVLFLTTITIQSDHLIMVDPSTTLPMEGVSILYIMADGFDNTEYTGAKQFFEQFGCSSTVAGPESSLTGLHDTFVTADILISQINLADYDCIYIPGGPASGVLAAMPSVTTLIHEANTLNMTLAAICGGPLVFAASGIISGRIPA